MVDVLTGRPGDRASGQGDLSGGDALVPAEQVHARVDQRQVREDLEKFPKCQPVRGSFSRAYSSSGLAQAGGFSHAALGRGSRPRSR